MDAFETCNVALANAMREMAPWQSEADVTESGGVLVVRGKSRFPTPYSNTVYRLDAAVPAEAVLAAADERLSDRRYMVWAHGDDGADVGRLATARGYVPLGHLPAMFIDTPPAAGSAGVEVRRVDATAELEDFVRVSQLAYAAAGLPERIAASLFARPEEVLRSAIVVLGFLDGRAVAAALAVVDAPSAVAGVYWVGTVPAARRRGAADAVMRFLTRAAFDAGARAVTLEASAEGEPVYRRIGYRVVGRYARWLAPPRT